MPSSQPFAIEVGEPTADELDVRVRGELDMSTAPELSAALVKAGEGASGPIKLDLSGVTFLDPSAIGALISAGQQLSASGRSLHIGKRSPIVPRTLEIMGLTEDSDAVPVLPAQGSAPWSKPWRSTRHIWASRSRAHPVLPRGY